MNKVVACLSFCFLNAAGMGGTHTLMDMLDPHAIIDGAVRDLFDDADDYPIEFMPAAALLKYEIKIPTLRSIISLREALQTGNFHAMQGYLQFEDFETKTLAPLPSFECPLKEVNAHIFQALQDGHMHFVEEKYRIIERVQKNSEEKLTEDDLFRYQAPIFGAFLAGKDLNILRKNRGIQLKANNDISRNERKNKIKQFEDEAEAAQINRSTYFAALATGDPAAINANRLRPIHLRMHTPLHKAITDLREQSKKGQVEQIPSECIKF